MIGVERGEWIAVLYRCQSAAVKRIVARRAAVPEAVVDDACQTAWTRLCERAEVVLDDDRAVMGWLVVTAVREAWRYTTRRYETPAGGWLAEAEPVGGAADPVEVALARERLGALSGLSERERRFIGLQAAGLSYEEIALQLGVSVRTTERQILRGRRKLREAGRL